ncbi:GntR family transcriptional regulator [Nonomuraea sp. NPDC050328]|uniref:GntR family transcriptional regulator n=1 Tax=Nonomuraea sp. NPDC050328 TaxID=3364361 RepID=UPI0037A8693C
MTEPSYLRVAADIRRRIQNGELAPGERLRARHELAADYGVAEGVIREATRLLATEGVLDSRPGAGMYVRERPVRRTLVRSWFRPRETGSPFAAEMETMGRQGLWTHRSDTMQAPPSVRARLALPEPGEEHDVMRTIYTFSSTDDERPWLYSTSYEPLEITKGTVIAFPEGGPYGGLGVTHRMAKIQILVDRWRERPGARPALPHEAAALKIPAGSLVLTVDRAYFAGERVVEVADIVVPAETTDLEYTGPVGELETWKA